MIIPGEDPAALDQLTAGYEQQFQPVGPVEASLLATVIRAAWMQQRFARIEASVISSRLAALPEDAVHPLGIVMTQDSSGPNTLQKIFRRQQAAQRDWYKAVEALERIQTVRRRAEAQAITAAPSTASYPNRVRFDVPALPAARPAAEAPVNLALRL